VIARLPDHGPRVLTRVLRYEPTSGRAVLWWKQGAFAGRTGIDFVDVTSGTVTSLDVDPVDADVVDSGIGLEGHALEEWAPLIARWHHEIRAEAGPIVAIEYPQGEAQVVQRDPDGTHPIVRDVDSFDAGDLARGSGGQLAWSTYARRHGQHVIALANTATPSTPPVFLVNAPSPHSLAWAADGSALFAVTRESVGRGVVSTGALLDVHRDCFVRIDPASNVVTPLRCSIEPAELSVAYDLTRTRAAVITARADRGAVDVELVALPSGESLGALANVEEPGSVTGLRGVVDAHGRLVAPALTGRGVAVIDVIAGKAWRTNDALTGLEVAEAARVDDHRWVAVRNELGDAPRAELVIVDTDAITALPPRAPIASPHGVVDPRLPVATAADRFWELPSPCPRGATLVATVSPAGTEHACLDPRGARVGRYAVVDGDRWLVRGRYAGGQRDGTWTYGARGHALLEMTLVRGRQHGPLRGWYADGQRRFTVTMRDGDADGRLRQWHPTGGLERDGTYARGEQHGSWRTWQPDGHPRSEAVYADDKLVGTSRSYRDDGIVREEIDWDANHRVALREYDETGALAREQRYVDDEVRVSRWYFPTGQIHQESEYRNNRPDGAERMWQPDGTLVYDKCVRDGIRTPGPCR
jgi:antitoxin component YwqK of YwqJK toxin-antitoxin module